MSRLSAGSSIASLGGLGLAVVVLVLLGVALGGSDPTNYHNEAAAFWLRTPHRLPAEYPPLALVLFLVTLLPAGRVALAVLMAAVLVAGHRWIARTWPGRETPFLVYLVAGAPALLLARYDLLPALLTLGVLAASTRRRHVLAYALLGIAIALKLYPVVLVPLLVIQQLREGRPPVRAVAAGLGVPALIAGGVYGLAAAVGGGSGFASLTTATQRPVQVESMPATVLWLASLAGIPVRTSFGYGSTNFTGRLAPAVTGVALAVLAAGALLTYYRFARGRISLGRAMIAVLGFLLVTTKVFSAQDVVWILPLVAVEEGLTAGWLLVALLTTADYPFLFSGLGVAHPPPPSLAFEVALGIRNALLGALTLSTLTGRPLPFLSRPLGHQVEQQDLHADGGRQLVH